MPNPTPVTLRASAAASSGGSSTPLDLGTLRNALLLRLDVSALSGTGAILKVFVETAPSSSGPWKRLGAFASAQATTFQELAFAPCERWARTVWELDGTTPSATFELGGNALVIYAVPGDLERYGLKRDAWGKVTTLSDAILQLIAASDEADGYLNNAFTLPLTAWANDLRKHVARMASVALLDNRGYDPTGPDALFRQNWQDDAIGWLKRLAQGQLTPPGFVDSTPELYDAGAYVVSDPPRGW